MWLCFLWNCLQIMGVVSSNCWIIVLLYCIRAWQVNSVTFDTLTLFRVHEQRLASLFAILSSDLQFVLTNTLIHKHKYKYTATNTNTQQQIHKYKMSNEKHHFFSASRQTCNLSGVSNHKYQKTNMETTEICYKCRCPISFC